MSQRSQRKEEHLALAKMFFNSNKDNDFNHVHLIRPALPESAVNKDSISTEMFGHKISAPFFINAMTGHFLYPQSTFSKSSCCRKYSDGFRIR